MSKKIIAIVPAGGVGERAHEQKTAVLLSQVQGAFASEQTHPAAADQTLPKQYRLLNAEPMLRLAVKALLADPRVQQVRVAVAPHDHRAQEALLGLPRTVCRPCGGPSRAATVTAALQDAQLDASDWVLVHDAARPGLPADALKRLIDSCLLHGVGGLLAQPVADTVKQGAEQTLADREACLLTGAGRSRDDCVVAVKATLARDSLWLAQTPQMFPAGLLLQALLLAQSSNQAITDEASAVELAGYEPHLVRGSARNFKVTWPEDFDLMEKWL